MTTVSTVDRTSPLETVYTVTYDGKHVLGYVVVHTMTGYATHLDRFGVELLPAKDQATVSQLAAAVTQHEATTRQGNHRVEGLGPVDQDRMALGEAKRLPVEFLALEGLCRSAVPGYPTPGLGVSTGADGLMT